MKTKFTAIVLLAALAGATGLAVRAGSAADGAPRPRAALADQQVAQLDKRLQERVEEQQELLAIIERLLQIQQSGRSPDALAAGVLTGLPRPPAAPVAAAAPAPRAASAPRPPWWTDYKPQMVYLSGADRYAVVNGRMLMRGQPVAADVVLEQIEEDRVVLRRGSEHFTYVLRK